MVNKTLMIIGGPTASGKTAAAITLAKHFQTEILSFDSRQLYRELPIGTCAPSQEELDTVPHHFIGHISVETCYNAADYAAEARATASRLFQQYDILVLVGGSGMYLDAFMYGLDDIPDIPPEVRLELDELFEKQGIHVLQEELQKTDPEYYEKVDQQNARRLIRALEVIRYTGQKFSAWRNGKKDPLPYQVIIAGIELEREILYEKINRRVTSIVKQGLVDEAIRVKAFREYPALQTVGYREAYAFLDGKMNQQEMIENIRKNTRHYAKRQITWFKKYPGIAWLPAGNTKTLLDFFQIHPPR